jgi:hypothetical protein
MRLALFALAVAVTGCRADNDLIRTDVEFLAAQEGAEVEPACARVVRHGHAALPPVEAALHTAEPHGRKNLILALHRIGDGDAIPLLRHVALHDAEADVRHEAEWTLRQWAAGKDARAERARAALREIDEQRGSEATG